MLGDSDGWTDISGDFYGDEPADHTVWMDAIVDSAPVCLRRPPAPAPCRAQVVYAERRFVFKTRFEAAHQIRGPPERRVA